jgi:hypothetical protein
MSETEKNVLIQGAGKEAVRSFERVLIVKPSTVMGGKRITLGLADGKTLDGYFILGTLKAREKRGDEMVDCVDTLRVDKTSMTPGPGSIWVNFSEITSWEMTA